VSSLDDSEYFWMGTGDPFVGRESTSDQGYGTQSMSHITEPVYSHVSGGIINGNRIQWPNDFKVEVERNQVRVTQRTPSLIMTVDLDKKKEGKVDTTFDDFEVEFKATSVNTITGSATVSPFLRKIICCKLAPLIKFVVEISLDTFDCKKLNLIK